METANIAMDDRTRLIDSILDLYGDFCARLLIGQPDSWLSIDLTMPQIKVLILIVARGQMTGSQLARALGVSLPSASRFVDRLAEHGLLNREEDAIDRRVTNLVPTPAARRLVDGFNNYRREYLGATLTALGLEQLREVERGFAHLVSSAPQCDAETESAGATEAGAPPGPRQEVGSRD